MIGALVVGVVLLVGVAAMYSLVTGQSIWESRTALGTILITYAMLDIACLPLGFWLAYRMLRGGRLVPTQDSVILESKSESLFFP